MTTKMPLLAMLAFVALAGWSFGAVGDAAAGSDREAALAKGATQLTAEEIAARFAGKTVTFAAAGGGKRFLIYYGRDNDAVGKKIGGGWSDSGFYAVADNDTICLSWDNRDKPRLRCMHVLLVDGVLQKFKADGSLSGSIEKLEEGKIL